MAETAGLEQARVEYRKTADALAKVTTGSQQTYNATFLAGRALEFARTCGDLAVRGIEEFAKASADYRRGEEERARAVFASTKMRGAGRS